MNVKRLNIMLEINNELAELKTIGLSALEVDGFLDYYIDNWINIEDYDNVKH